jgi:hypothetical protein
VDDDCKKGAAEPYALGLRRPRPRKYGVSTELNGRDISQAGKGKVPGIRGIRLSAAPNQANGDRQADAVVGQALPRVLPAVGAAQSVRRDAGYACLCVRCGDRLSSKASSVLLTVVAGGRQPFRGSIQHRGSRPQSASGTQRLRTTCFLSGVGNHGEHHSSTRRTNDRTALGSARATPP